MNVATKLKTDLPAATAPNINNASQRDVRAPCWHCFKGCHKERRHLQIPVRECVRVTLSVFVWTHVGVCEGVITKRGAP